MDVLITLLLWVTAISAGIMAGVYFTFSAFVMRSLDAIEAPAGMLAMQSINRIIVKSSFLPVFFGSTLSALIVTVAGALDLSRPGASYMALGGAAYVIGMFVVTLVGNVPLNNQLEASEASGPDGARMWALYLQRWTAWNHVRTASCTASLVLLICALVERS